MDDEIITQDFQEEETSASEAKNGGTVIYVGPDVLRMGLKKFRIYQDGNNLPYEVKQAIAAVPEVEKLIIPTADIEKICAKINKSGTPEHEYYLRVQNF